MTGNRLTARRRLRDVLHGAEPTSGPAARPLPQLPLAIDEDGVLYAQSDFTESVGPGFWDAT